MKKRILVIVIVLLAAFLASIPLVNNLLAKNVERQLTGIALPDNTQLVESVSKAGKLVGNGNGMQYFGAILLQSEETLDDLSYYYSSKAAGVVVKQQISQKIECIDHRQLSFQTPVSEAEHYYIVYLFGSGISPFSELDLRGH